MKKKLSMVLALVLVLLFAGQALAASISASYKDGVISFTVSDFSGRGEIWLDGGNTGVGVKDGGSGTISRTLSDGTHTLTVSGLSGSASTTFTVGAAPTESPEPTATPEPTVEPTVTPEPTVEPTHTPVPTEEPDDAELSIGASYKNGVITYTVKGVHSRLELWLDGASTGVAVNRRGTFTLAKPLTPGTHTLEVSSPTQDATCTIEAPQIKMGASYKDGVITVNVSDVSAKTEVWVDGADTFVGIDKDGVYTIPRELSHGEHTVLVSNPVQSASATIFVHTVEVTEGKPATCTEDGYTESKICSVCGDVAQEQEVIKATGHKEVVLSAKAPTCTDAGKTEGKICSACGEVLMPQEEIPALGHVVENIPAKAPTCTEYGSTAGEMCSVCGEILSACKSIRPMGHNYMKNSVTEGDLSYDEWKCSVCGDSYRVSYKNAAAQDEEGLGDIVTNIDWDLKPYDFDKDNAAIIAKSDEDGKYTLRHLELNLGLIKELINDYNFDEFTFDVGGVKLNFSLKELADNDMAQLATFLGMNMNDYTIILTLDPEDSSFMAEILDFANEKVDITESIASLKLA